jgi:hypothetical protein
MNHETQKLNLEVNGQLPHPSRITHERNPDIALNWSQVGSRVGLDSLEKKEFSYPFRETKQEFGRSACRLATALIPLLRSSYKCV